MNDLLHSTWLLICLPLVAGWLLDRWFGDPSWLPHPVVLFGKMIGSGERLLNHGGCRRVKGALLALALVAGIFVVALPLHYFSSLAPAALLTANTLVVFFCLAGTTLVREVRAVFEAADRSVDEGRRQVARIVGRDTAQLSAQEVRTAALETLAENLSDGVIAPVFWYVVLGVPGMLAYKMVNTLDSMIGYRNDRYRRFGSFAARMDDVANFIPARLTALLMIVCAPVALLWRRKGGGVKSHNSGRGFGARLRFVLKYGSQHVSPNSGWPEAALAGILDCRFGGPHEYFGKWFPKPYIGANDRQLTTDDMQTAVRVNLGSELLMLVLVLVSAAFV